MSLVVRYKFNEPTADLTTDSSGNSNNLGNGGAVSVSDATYGDVAYFNNSPMTFSGMPTDFTQRTFSFWVKPASFYSVQMIFGHSTNASNDSRMQWNYFNNLRIFSRGDKFEPVQTWSTGTWYHIVLTYNGTEDSLYVDGSFHSSKTRTYTINDATLRIGGSPAYSGEHELDGYLSDFRVYDYGLSAAEVSTLYADGPNPTIVQDGIVQDGAIGYFDANNTDSYTSGSETMYDLLGSDLTMVTVPGLVPPLNDGGLDFSTQTNYMQTSKKIVIRTISLWYKKTDSVVSNPVFLDQGEISNFIQYTLGGTGTKHGPFFESCTVYVDGVETNLSDWNNLAHGELHNVVFMGSQDSVESILTIFANPAPAYTFRAILYSILLYDRELTGEELLQNYIGGGGTVIVDTSPLTATPSVFFMDVEWEVGDGVLFYKIEYVSENSTDEVIISVQPGETNISTRLYNLQADSSYTLTLYTSLDNLDFEQVGDTGSSFSTLENVVDNIDVETLKNSEGIVDLSNFDTDDIDEHLDALFDTGDEIVRTVNDEKVTTTFVKDGGTVPLEAGAYSFPFSTSNGGGQTAGLGDLDVLFDDVNNQVVIDGVSYANGESFTIDGKIVTVYTI